LAKITTFALIKKRFKWQTKQLYSLVLFDPFTNGHFSVVTRSLPLFDKVIIAIGNNTGKNAFFTVQERIELIKDVFNQEPKIEVQSYDGLTVEFCKLVGASYMIRGIRTVADFEYECAVSQMNKLMLPGLNRFFY
jgi:pantetheine-phosphate adenylyltransferase